MTGPYQSKSRLMSYDAVGRSWPPDSAKFGARRERQDPHGYGWCYRTAGRRRRAYTRFRVPRIVGDYYSGGWTATVQVSRCRRRGVPDNAKIILSRGLVRRPRLSIGGYLTGRKSCLPVDLDETVVQRFATAAKICRVQSPTIDGLMKSLEGCIHTVEDGADGRLGSHRWLKCTGFS